MSSFRKPSPSRSVGGEVSKRPLPPRRSRSVNSPTPSNASVRLSTVIQEYNERNGGSFVLSPVHRKSVLTDNTNIEEPRRQSWWQMLDENSREYVDIMEDPQPPPSTANAEQNNIMEELDIEILSQEKRNFTLDLPESSDNESINSIVLPQRKLFTEKEHRPQQKFGMIKNNRATLAKINKSTTKDVTLPPPKKLFQNIRSKPVFPEALLVSPNTTAMDSPQVLPEPRPQIRNLFGHNQGVKRKNMLVNYNFIIESENEADISEIQPKVFGFQKKPDGKQSLRKRSSISSNTTDIELDDWRQLPSSTLVENQLEAMIDGKTPNRERLSKLSEAKESVAESSSATVNKTKQSNKSASRNKSMEDKENSLSKSINRSHVNQQAKQPDKEKALDNKEVENEQDKNLQMDNDEQLVEHEQINKDQQMENDIQHVEITQENDNDQEKQTEQGNEDYQMEIEQENEDQETENDDQRAEIDDADVEMENERENDDQSNQKVDDHEIESEVENDNQNVESEQEDENQDIENNELEVESKDHNLESEEDKDDQQEETIRKSEDEEIENEVEIDDQKKESEQENAEQEIENDVQKVESAEEKVVDKQLQNDDREQESEQEEISEQENDEQEVSEQENDEQEVSEQENDEQQEVSEQENDDQDEVSEQENDEHDVVSEQENDEHDGVGEQENNEQEVVDEQENDENDEVSEQENDEQEVVSEQENVDQEIENEEEHDDREVDSEDNNDQQIESDQENDDQQMETDHEAENDQASDNEEIDATPEVSHDTTGRKIRKDLMPEKVLDYVPNNLDTSIDRQNRNSRMSKTFNAPAIGNLQTESMRSSYGARNSSAEGSGWDSHRTTRKTLRQTFGKDFTMRKSLRTLVMEKSAKRQTLHNKGDITSKFPQANSTEIHDDTDHHSEADCSDTPDLMPVETYLQKVVQRRMESRMKIREKIRSSLLNITPRDPDNPFKVPRQPMFPRKAATKSAKPKDKPMKKSLIALEDLPAEFIQDMKYKPPKRFQPNDASWITKRLYNHLETKLEAKYGYKKRVRAEKLVQSIYGFTRELRRRDTAAPGAVDALKHELARLELVKTHFDFYEFFYEFLPREVIIKVVPDVANRIPVPHGVFDNIIK